MLGIAVAGLLSTSAPLIVRDSYGVPYISAPTEAAAFRLAGRAVAEDRLWQLELSRRLARGQMAEVLGGAYAAADKETRQSFYTDGELDGMLRAASPRLQAAYSAYAQGINDHISAATASGKLPSGYAKAGFNPRKWTTTDSVAIAVRMAQKFGVGGAGELRNYAIYLYLKGQPAKDRALDVMDDLAWQNDPGARTTIQRSDDPLRSNPPSFPKFGRADTQRQLASLPPSSVFELMPAIRLAERSAAERVAQRQGLVYRTGSYAVAVSSKVSGAAPMLLSGPEMGHSTPSVIHEMTIDTPTLRVTGMDVPGIPGVLVGYTPRFAWGLTTDLADTQDVYFAKLQDGGYLYGGQRKSFVELPYTIQVKGGQPVTGVQRRTRYGPVLLESPAGKYVYTLRSSFWKRELQGFEALFAGYGAKSPQELDKQFGTVSVGFNVLYAFRNGDIGYRYCGLVPIRAAGLDPRLPTPAEPRYEWKGLIPPERMPHVIAPKSGILYNWNSKPVAWWPNLDTPIWGSVFQTDVLADALRARPLSYARLLGVPATIARGDTETSGAFIPVFRDLEGSAAELSPLERSALSILKAYNGVRQDGSASAAIYAQTVNALRTELFMRHIGSFLSPSVFALVARPTTILKALAGRTKYDYLAGRTAQQVLRAAFGKAVEQLAATQGPQPTAWAYKASAMRYGDQPPIPYASRGTFIQVVRGGAQMSGRSVQAPGIAESGEHAFDQVPLARNWKYKPMGW